MKKRITKALKNPVNIATVGAACTTLAASIMPILAIDVDVDIDTTFGKILGVVCSIFLYLGILLLVWSIAQLVLAFKNEDADSKSRAMMLLIVSIVLISIKPIVSGILGIDETKITNPLD